MNRLASLLSANARVAWAVIAFAGFVLSGLVWSVDTHLQAQQRLALMQTEARRSAIEIMSTTLNGNLMGSVTMLGLLDNDIKQDAQNGLLSIDAAIDSTLMTVGNAFDAEGVLVVASDGKVKTAWDRLGKSSTGMDVKFRPYYQMAMQGKTNVYAAISLARGERSLYFAAPVYSERARSNTSVGAVVARTSLDRVDKLLQGRFDLALLLSPQGVVFASNRNEWIGYLEGAATPQRLKAIRDLRQFGSLFDTNDPPRLPLAARDSMQNVEGTRYAVATADVDWNDPAGPWKLVVLDDLSVSAPLEASAARAVAAALAFWVVGWMVMHLFKGRHIQNLATQRLEQASQLQERQLRLRTQLAQATARLQQCTEIEQLAQCFLSEVHALFGALQGVVYARAAQSPEGVFALRANFACDAKVPSVLHAGEGLLGQCAIERQLRILDTANTEQWRIHSGLGATQPDSVVLAPLEGHDTVLGVVEIALMTRDAPFASDEFTEFVQHLTLNLQVLLRAEETQASLLEAEAVRQANTVQLHFQQTLIDTIPYPVFYKDESARYVGFNRAYEKSFGVSRDTLIGRCVLDLEYLPLEDRQRYQAEDLATIASVGSVRKFMPIPFADGRMHHTLYYVCGFRKADGSPGGLVGTFMDLDTLSTPSGVDGEVVA